MLITSLLLHAEDAIISHERGQQNNPSGPNLDDRTPGRSEEELSAPNRERVDLELAGISTVQRFNLA